MKEIWKDIKGYESLYQVSNQGKVKSLERVKSYFHPNGQEIFQRVPERILKGAKNKNKSCKTPYHSVTLWKDGKVKNKYIHRLVAEAFIYNPENKPCINHIDGNGENNHVMNLEWCTYSENQKHNYDSLGHKTSERQRMIVSERMKKNNPNKGQFKGENNPMYKHGKYTGKKKNGKSTKLSKANKSGYSGVSWSNSDEKWISNITVDRKRKFLGRFSTLTEAVQARNKYIIENNLEHEYKIQEFKP